MRRLWIRWGLLVAFVVVMATLFINLGQWQLRRLDERQARNEVVRSNSAAAPITFNAAFGEPITDQQQWQRVIVRGTFDPTHQIQVRYRQNNAAPGYEVVTPLRTESGQVLLVDRGFIKVPSGQRIPDAVPAPPPGVVTVTGQVRRNERGKPNAIDPVNNQVRLINSVAIGKTLPYPVVDGYLGALSTDPPQQGGFESVQPPELSDGPHFWYAVQWFMFSLIGVAGVVVFIRSDLKQRRHDATSRAGVPASTPDITTPTKD